MPAAPLSPQLDPIAAGAGGGALADAAGAGAAGWAAATGLGNGATSAAFAGVAPLGVALGVEMTEGASLPPPHAASAQHKAAAATDL